MPCVSCMQFSVYAIQKLMPQSAAALQVAVSVKECMCAPRLHCLCKCSMAALRVTCFWSCSFSGAGPPCISTSCSGTGCMTYNVAGRAVCSQDVCKPVGINRNCCWSHGCGRCCQNSTNKMENMRRVSCTTAAPQVAHEQLLLCVARKDSLSLHARLSSCHDIAALLQGGILQGSRACSLCRCSCWLVRAACLKSATADIPFLPLPQIACICEGGSGTMPAADRPAAGLMTPLCCAFSNTVSSKTWCRQSAGNAYDTMSSDQG